MSGSTIAARVAAAQARADAARARLGGTIGELKQRVSPQALAQDAAATLKDKGIAVARDLAAGAQARPATFAAVAGGIALFFLRHRVAALARRATGNGAKSSSPESAPSKGPAR